MRLNKFLATHTALSRRSADTAIQNGRVHINGEVAGLGSRVQNGDRISLDGKPVTVKSTESVVVLLNKPTGYVCSRNGQGAETIYDLLLENHQNLNPVGRLDKDSSGLLVMTNDGELAHQLTHPSFRKEKVYVVTLDKELTDANLAKTEQGVMLDDGMSALKLSGQGKEWEVRMHEGRNRQIRRTFEALGYRVTKLHRTHFGDYELGNLRSGDFRPA